MIASEVRALRQAHAALRETSGWRPEFAADVFTADDVCELLRPIRNRLDELAAGASKDHSGSGGWWELSGYATVLDDAMQRIRRHRARVENVNKQIARERADPAVAPGESTKE